MKESKWLPGSARNVGTWLREYVQHRSEALRIEGARQMQNGTTQEWNVKNDITSN